MKQNGTTGYYVMTLDGPKFRYSRGATSKYVTGVRHEEKVASRYNGAGWMTQLSQRSRGAQDIVAVNPKNNETHFVQCKGTVAKENPYWSANDVKRLINSAKEKGAEPICASVFKDGTILLVNARTGKEVRLKGISGKGTICFIG